MNWVDLVLIYIAFLKWETKEARNMAKNSMYHWWHWLIMLGKYMMLFFVCIFHCACLFFMIYFWLTFLAYFRESIEFSIVDAQSSFNCHLCFTDWRNHSEIRQWQFWSQCSCGCSWTQCIDGRMWTTNVHEAAHGWKWPKLPSFH